MDLQPAELRCDVKLLTANITMSGALRSPLNWIVSPHFAIEASVIECPIACHACMTACGR